MTDSTTFAVTNGIAQIRVASDVLWLLGILVWFGLYATYTTIRDTALDLLFRLSMWWR